MRLPDIWANYFREKKGVLCPRKKKSRNFKGGELIEEEKRSTKVFGGRLVQVRLGGGLEKGLGARGE